MTSDLDENLRRLWRVVRLNEAPVTATQSDETAVMARTEEGEDASDQPELRPNLQTSPEFGLDGMEPNSGTMPPPNRTDPDDSLENELVEATATDALDQDEDEAPRSLLRIILGWFGRR